VLTAVAFRANKDKLVEAMLFLIKGCKFDSTSKFCGKTTKPGFCEA
jgi:hypothetical protein